MPVDDNAFLSLRNANGQTAWLHASCTEWKNLFSLEIYGRLGKLHWEGLGHAFVNIQMYLDYDRQGFDFPIIPVQVNSYGSKIIRNRRCFVTFGRH